MIQSIPAEPVGIVSIKELLQHPLLTHYGCFSLRLQQNKKYTLKLRIQAADLHGGSFEFNAQGQKSDFPPIDISTVMAGSFEAGIKPEQLVGTFKFSLNFRDFNNVSHLILTIVKLDTQQLIKVASFAWPQKRIGQGFLEGQGGFIGILTK